MSRIELDRIETSRRPRAGSSSAPSIAVGPATLVVLVGLLAPASAEAHLVSTRFGAYYSGMLHPLTAIEHLLPWLAIALFAALQPTRAARWLLVAFPLAVAVGAAAALLLPGPVDAWIEVAEVVNLASLIVAGLLVMLASRVGLWLLLAVACAFGASHGFANGSALAPGDSAVLFIAGVATTAYLLAALGTGAAHRLALGYGWGTTAVRAAGSWVLAIGVLAASVQYLAAS